MHRIRVILSIRKWKIDSHSYTNLCKPAAVDTALKSGNFYVSLTKSFTCMKPTETNLCAFLNGIENPKNARDIDLIELLALLRTAPMLDVDAMEVLRCCSSKHVRHTHVLDDIWTQLKLKTVPLNVHHYNAMLRIYLENDIPFSPRAMLDEIIGREMKPNVVTCNTLILSYAMKGDVYGALAILEEMKKNDIAINLKTFNNLILSYANAGDGRGMNEILTTMKSKGSQTDSETLNNLLKGYAKVGDADKLNETFELFRTENVELLNSDVFNVINELDANGHSDKIDEFFKRFTKSMEYRYSAKAFITAAAQRRRFDLIEKVLAHRADDQWSLTSMAQYYLAEAVQMSCTETEIDRIWHLLESLNITIESNIGVYLPAALRSSSAALVRATLDQMKAQDQPIRDEHFKNLLYLESGKGPEAVLAVMHVMRYVFDVRPRCTMLRDTFLPLFGFNDHPLIGLAKLLTLELGITRVLTAVITRCILDRNLGGAVEIANTYKNHYLVASNFQLYLVQAIKESNDLENFVRFVRILNDDAKCLRFAKCKTQPPTKEQILEQQYFGSYALDQTDVVGEIICNAIMSVSCDSSKIEPLLKRLVSEGLRISKEFALRIENILCIEADSPLASLLIELSDPELKLRPLSKPSHFIAPHTLLSSNELINLIEMAESRGHSVAGCKRLLVQAYIAENDLFAAEELFHDSDIGQSKQIYSSFVSLCLNRRDIEKALDYYERAHAHCGNFILSRSQVMKITANLLLRGHEYEEIKLLMNAKGIKTAFLEEGIDLRGIYMLNEAAESGDVNLTNEFFDWLLKNGHIKPSVKTTSSLVSVHLQNDNTTEAFNAFEKAYAKYGFTPLKINVLSKLIKQDDMNRLEKMFEIISAAHGEHIALRVLAYAFIMAGQIKQTTIVLSNNVLVNGHPFLSQDAKYFYRRGQIDVLKGMLEATKTLHYNRSDIYRCLYLHHCKSNERDEAIDVFSEQKIRDNCVHSAKYLNEIELRLSSEPAESAWQIDKTEYVISQNTSNTVQPTEPINSTDEQQINEKLTLLLMQNEENIFEATEIVLVALKSNVNIGQAIMSHYLAKVAELGDTSLYEKLWNYSDVKNSPNFSQFYLQAHLNSAYPMRYIAKMEKLLESADDPTVQQHDDINKFVRVEDNLKFLQEHPHVINEYESMAIKAANANRYAAINVVWLYHFMSESPFIESLWSQYFASKPENFQTIAMIRTLNEEKCHMKLKKLADFLVANDRMVEAALVHSERLRIYMDTNCLEDAIKVLELSPIPFNYFDQTILDKLKQRLEANGSKFPISMERADKIET